MKHLTIEVGETEMLSVIQFLDDITAPSLETLEVESKHGQGFTFLPGIASLRSLLNRSACSLHTFSLVDSRWTVSWTFSKQCLH